MRSPWQVGVVAAFFAILATAAQAQQSYSEAGEKPYIDRKDWSGLLAYTQAWTHAEPNDPLAWYGLGMTYIVGLNQPRPAADAFRRAVTLRPEWPQAWAHLASVQSQMPGRPSDVNAIVLATLREERQHMTHATAYEWTNLGFNFSQQASILDHEPDREAIDAYTQSLNINPKNSIAWYDRGVAEGDLGNYSAALSDYQHASQLGLARATESYNQLRQSLASPRPRPRARSCYFANLPEATAAGVPAAVVCSPQ